MPVIINGTNGISDVNGTAAAPAITGGDSDTGLYFGTNLLGLSTGGTNALYIDSSQNVGIGTTSPANKLDVNGAISNNADLISTGGRLSLYRSAGASYVDWSSGQNLIFRTETSAGGAGATEFMRIDSSGNVGIGTTSPGSLLSVYKPTGEVFLTTSTNTVSWLTGIASGGNYAIYSNNAQPITFSTNAAERMRIDSAGNVGIGTTPGSIRLFTSFSTNADTVKFENTNASFTSAVNIWATNVAAGTSAYYVYAVANGVNTLQIFNNGNVRNTNGSYAAISDEKIKENIVDTAPKLNDLMKVKVRNYNLKKDLGYEDHKQIGVIAQELETVFPGLVEETQDRDADGNNLDTTTKSVKYSVFVPILIKAIQELKAELDELKGTK